MPICYIGTNSQLIALLDNLVQARLSGFLTEKTPDEFCNAKVGNLKLEPRTRIALSFEFSGPAPSHERMSGMVFIRKRWIIR